MNQPKIYFLHIHKAAGSTFINIAKQNCTLYKTNSNGNPKDSSGKLIRFWEWEIPKQLNFVMADGYDLVANEKCIGKNHIIDSNIAYITILRDPIDRVYSQFRHEQMLKHVKPNISFASFIKDISPDNKYKIHYKWVSNYIVKQFSYDNTIQIASEKDLEIAKSRIKNFNNVFFLDKIANDIQKMNSYGWKIIDVNKYRKGTTNLSNARASLSEEPEVLEKILELNKLDLQLYNFAKNLSSNTQ